MVPVRVADEEDLDVSELESEPLHTGPDERNVLLKIAVDQDVPLRSGDEIVSEVFAVNILEILRDF